MGRIKGPMQQGYPTGSPVKIAKQGALEEFMRTWKYHHPLQPEQVEFAGRIGEVESYGFYHGGDELYKVEGIPGTWPEVCLELVRQLARTESGRNNGNSS